MASREMLLACCAQPGEAGGQPCLPDRGWAILGGLLCPAGAAGRGWPPSCAWRRARRSRRRAGCPPWLAPASCCKLVISRTMKGSGDDLDAMEVAISRQKKKTSQKKVCGVTILMEVKYWVPLDMASFFPPNTSLGV